jgi:thiol-disulfide isomerase/thioredoxin
MIVIRFKELLNRFVANEIHRPGPFFKTAVSGLNRKSPTGTALALLAYGIILFSGAKGLEARQLPTDFRLVSSDITMAPGGSSTVELEVRIPKNNHIYVKNATALSFNIVTEFRIPEGQGFGVELKEAPEAERYETDFILRGQGREKVAGTYKLEVFEQLGRSESNRTLAIPLVIKTQMCDSKTNVCFRPQEFKKLLRIRIQGEKTTISFRSKSDVNWVTSYDEAFKKAKSSGKNVFVIITAPSWCGYCRYLERDVFSKASVAETLNQGFVPLRLLDTNADRNKFQFSGYPSMKVASPAGKILKDGGIGRQEQSFLAAIAPFAKEAEVDEEVAIVGDDSYRASLMVRIYREGDQWILQSPLTGTQGFTEARRDEKYIILKHSSRQEFLAVPLQGKVGYHHDGKGWKEAFKVE